MCHKSTERTSVFSWFCVALYFRPLCCFLPCRCWDPSPVPSRHPHLRPAPALVSFVSPACVCVLCTVPACPCSTRVPSAPRTAYVKGGVETRSRNQFDVSVSTFLFRWTFPSLRKSSVLSVATLPKHARSPLSQPVRRAVDRHPCSLLTYPSPSLLCSLKLSCSSSLCVHEPRLHLARSRCRR